MRRFRGSRPILATSIAFLLVLAAALAGCSDDSGGTHRHHARKHARAKIEQLKPQSAGGKPKPAVKAKKKHRHSHGNASQETNPPAAVTPEESCTLVHHPVKVRLSKSEYPRSTHHILVAIRRGEPRVLHIDREDADQHRDESLAGIPTKDGLDRDEYPLAFTKEGGEGADIAYVPLSDNRGSGSSIGGQLREFCDGQAFKIKLTR